MELAGVRSPGGEAHNANLRPNENARRAADTAIRITNTIRERKKIGAVTPRNQFKRTFRPSPYERARCDTRNVIPPETKSRTRKQHRPSPLVRFDRGKQICDDGGGGEKFRACTQQRRTRLVLEQAASTRTKADRAQEATSRTKAQEAAEMT